MKVRFHIRVAGQVQGVFFRRTAKLQAEELGILGWVKNNDDGSVDVMAQGEKDKIDQFVKWCKKGPPFAKVENIEVKEQKGLEGFEDFSIHD